MRTKFPIRLKNDPIAEAIWELRFDASAISNAGEVMPGMLFSALKDRYVSIDKLPAAEIPPMFFQHDPNLRYVPTVRLRSDRFSIQIGSHVIGLSCVRPYVGWDAFGAEIRLLAEKVRDSNLFGKAERFSLKYTNVIPSEHVTLRINGYDLGGMTSLLRTEIEEDDCVSIVQIGSTAKSDLSSGTITGILLDIDTIRNCGPKFWDCFDSELERARRIGRSLFFNILTDKALESFGPIYDAD